MIKLNVLFWICFFCPMLSAAQTGIEFADDLEQDPGCEMTAKIVEDVFREALAEHESLFLISRIGEGEKKPLGWQRLNRIEARFAFVQKKPRLIVAEGRPTPKGKGVLELWVGSKPRAIIRLKRNEQLCVDTPTNTRGR